MRKMKSVSSHLLIGEKTSKKLLLRLNSKMSKRPENLAFPQVWYTFKAKDKNSDNIVEYRVQDLPEDYYEQTVDFMVKYFLPDETFCSSRDTHNKPSAVKCFRKVWDEAIKQKISIGCFKNDGSSELVGANVLLIYSKDDPEDDSEVKRCYERAMKKY